MPHPSEEQLLRYSDGELPGRASSQVHTHLKACWQCRTNLEEIENTVGACVRYRTTVLQRHQPAPPAPWTDIYRSFAEIDATLPQPGLADRLLRALAWPVHNPRKWVPAAVALMLAVGLFYRYRLTPSVQASELLQKAVVAADSHPAKAHLLRIRTKAASVTRRTGPDHALASNSGDQQTLNSVETLFHNANYNWDDPLSARSYSAWRDQLSARRDQVLQQQDSYRIRTATDSGDLLDASLQLRSQDLQPTEGRFEFRNRDWVEITAIPDLAEPLATAVAPVPELHAAAPLAPSTNITPSSPAPTIADELRLLSALHGIGADLGDPLEITRDSSQIVVSGVGIAPERQQQIQQAVNSLPNVLLRFTESDAAPQATAPETPATADMPQVQARIAEQMGGRARFDQIAAQALDLSDPLMARAYALRRLAEKFPVEANLNPEDLATLRRLQRDHASALREQTRELEQVLKPALKSVPVGQASGLSETNATEDLFQSARRVEKLLAIVFGAAPSDSAVTAELPAQLLSAVTDLRAKVEAYDHLLAKTER
jgi:anti-sigma factor RsiW